MPVFNTTDSAREALLNELMINSSPNTPEALKAIEKFEERINISFKKKIISIVVVMFFMSVLTLWAGLWWVGSNEYELIKLKIISPDGRIVTERLLLALIAGTVTQVSISFGLMIKYLFQGEKMDEK